MNFDSTSVVLFLSLLPLAVVFLAFPQFRKFENITWVLPTYTMSAVCVDSIKRGAAQSNLFPLALIGSAVFFAIWKLRSFRPPVSALSLSAMFGLGLITFYLSGPQGGAGKFVFFLENVLHLSPEVASLVNFCVRKSIHLTLYGSLALSAFKVSIAQGGTLQLAFCGGLGWGVVHAVLDEFSQSKVATRTGSPGDVMIDVLGMVLFLGLFGRNSGRVESSDKL